MENKFKEGDLVRAKVDPTVEMLVRRYVKGIYYCRIPQDPLREDLVYFERELVKNDI